jgi:uncharacterized protein (UPF0332 family)
MYDESANRAYYAAFQAARAALSAIGIATDKARHKAVQANFNNELVQKRKVYPSRLKSCLLDLLFARNAADYGPEFLSRKIAQRQISQAQEFVLFVAKEISKL